MKREDYFYYGKLHGIPIFFQPEDNTVIGRNRFCEFLLWLIEPFEEYLATEYGFAIVIEKRTITRQKLIEKGLLEE